MGHCETAVFSRGAVTSTLTLVVLETSDVGTSVGKFFILWVTSPFRYTPWLVMPSYPSSFTFCLELDHQAVLYCLVVLFFFYSKHFLFSTIY